MAHVMLHREKHFSRSRLVPPTTSFLLVLPGASLYVATAFVGVWVSFSPFYAWLRFLLILGTVALMLLATTLHASLREHFWRWLGPLAAGMGGGLAVLFLLALGLGDRVLPTWISVQADTIDGLLVVLFPLALAGAWRAWQGGYTPVERGAMVLAVALMVAAVLLSESKAPKLTLLIGGLALGYLQVRARLPGARLMDVGLYVLLPLGALVVFLWLLRLPAEAFPPGFLVGRLTTWRKMALLVGDYPFTGSGLVGTGMVYSTYVHLVHVPYLYHAYQLFLQVAIEQGLLGMAGLATLAAIAVWYSGPWRAERWTVQRAAVHASVLTFLVYGMLDSETYTGVFMPVLFLPLIATFALIVDSDRRSSRQIVALQVGGLAALVVGIVLAIVGIPQVQARWHANLGSVYQTQVELKGYRWPTIPIQDEIRRLRAQELAPAFAHFQAALDLDPNDPVANRRLGQMELSLGRYDEAREHLERAYRMDPAHRATRQMLGEVYAIQGQVAEAARLWSTLDLDNAQLEIRRWWYQYIGEPARADRIRMATVETDP